MTEYDAEEWYYGKKYMELFKEMQQDQVANK